MCLLCVCNTQKEKVEEIIIELIITEKKQGRAAGGGFRQSPVLPSSSFNVISKEL